MFTGIVEELGTVKGITKGSRSCRLGIGATKVVEDVKLGDSIAVNGVCLTVVEFGAQYFVADVMPETFDKTNLRYLHPGEKVNLERALRLQDRLGGHLVLGHVDGVGRVMEQTRVDIAVVTRISAPPGILKYTMPKGSVAVDGISLTVVDVLPDCFTVSLIPHTAKSTTLGFKRPGDYVNLEADVIGKYVERLVQDSGGKKSTMGVDVDFLRQHGFI